MFSGILRADEKTVRQLAHFVPGVQLLRNGEEANRDKSK